ncbi:MAG: glycosyltransferase family 4 protein [Lachnospiraceae bacterium]|nr:glycosyltransferase family 4 protein [Lachnospiraceae bacterium]
MNGKELRKKCKELPYSRDMIAEERVISSTMDELRSLWEKEDPARVLGALSSLWSYRDAATFFVKAGFETSRRRIKTIATYYHRAYAGGVERVNAELMKIWTGMGYRVVFFCAEGPDPLDFSYPETVKRIVIPVDDEAAHLSALRKACEEEQVDLYVNNAWTKQDSLWECVLMKLLHIPYVQYCHGNFAWCFREGENAFYQTDAFRLCDMVVAISETNARFYQLCGCRSFLVQNPVPEELARDVVPSGEDSDRVLLIGRLGPEKYPLEALEIFRHVRKEIGKVHLDIVGSGELEEAAKAYVRENGLSECVSFHGYKNEKEIAEHYKKAACVLFTSKMEGYPMILLEAKAYGLPVVMYDLSYLSLFDGGKGILSAPLDDLEKMKANLLTLMKDAKLRKKLGKEARESFERFSSHDQAADWSSIIFLLSENPKSSDPESCYAPLTGGADRFILPMLMDEVKKGYRNFIENDRSYKTGRAVLKIPRTIKNSLKELKENSASDKDTRGNG